MSRAPSKNAPCPCGSGRRTKACCGPVIAGAPAQTPDALMRSRYTAYATGAAGHIMRTTAPESPHHVADAARWRREIEAWCRAVRFDGLAVLSSQTDGDRGEVVFFATLTAATGDVSFGERSRFVRREGRWLYVDGTRTDCNGDEIAEEAPG